MDVEALKISEITEKVLEPGSKDVKSADPQFSESENSVSVDQELKHGDSLPDLIWPEKKIDSNVKQSESHDTGFSSDGAADILSPDEEQKSVTQIPNGDVEDFQQNADGSVKDDDVMDILGNGLLTKKVLVPGKGEDTRPGNGDSVTIRVDGVLSDGTHIDVQDFTFILGDGDVIVAFDIAVALMEATEKSDVCTAPRYAYDELGREPDVPRDATITYTIELIDIQPSEEISLCFEKRLQMGEIKRERGNYLYSRQDYTGAINSYGKAVKFLDSEMNPGLDESSHSLLMESWVKCYNNMAACQLKICAYDAAVRSCEKVLSSQENNVKALFRLGKAYGAKNDVDEALVHLKKAIKLDPESKMLHQEVLSLNRRKNKQTNTEKELYQRMLGVKPGEKTSTGLQEKNGNPIRKWSLVAGCMAAVVASIGMAYYKMS